MKRILVIEDDPVTAAEIAAALGDEGHAVVIETAGREGLAAAEAGGFDAVVLDRMLPGGMDGLSLLATLRSLGHDVPVLVLSALSAVDDRVRGLRAGGDDYLTKPFAFLELTARLDVLMRQHDDPAETASLRVGPLEVDLLTQSVRRGGTPIELLPREFKLLEYLMRNAGRIVTRTMMFEEVWHYRFGEPSNVIDVHVSKLRRKIEAPGQPPLIRTVRGAGYMIHAAG